jgi:hypothetical protein
VTSTVTIGSAADYEARALALLDQLRAVFETDGKDCAKLAGDLETFMTVH